MPRLCFAFTSLLVVCSGLLLDAASFDCAKAKSPDELTVCKEPTLSELDSEMAALWFAYRAVPMLMGANGARHDEAEQFLHDRVACGSNVNCLKNVYQSRVKVLKAEITRAMQAVAQEENNPPQTAPVASFALLPAPIEAAISGYPGQCSKLGGTPAAGHARPHIMSADFDGDEKPDYLLDPQNLQCTNAATAYCGNGGCQLSLFVSRDGYREPIKALGGSPTIVQSQGTAILEVWVGRTQCNLTAPDKACWATYSWKNGRLATTFQVRDLPRQ